MTWDRLRRDLVARLASLTRPTRWDWIFALRTASAGLIALFSAYALKLDHPQWAMMTVFIVAQPVAGMVLAKGFYRLLGTLAGGLAAIAMTSLFGANPWLLVAILAIWIGFCTLVSSLLRNPEAYGAALAGYTAMIIGLPAFGQPHLVVDLAVARCAEIVLGIVCAALTSRLILPNWRPTLSSGERQTATIAVARQCDSYRRTHRRGRDVQIAASLRVIAAAPEDFPDFFAKELVLALRCDGLTSRAVVFA